jgi:hypothetical protein
LAFDKTTTCLPSKSFIFALVYTYYRRQYISSVLGRQSELQKGFETVCGLRSIRNDRTSG